MKTSMRPRWRCANELYDSDPNAGTKSMPKATINAGLATAIATSKRDVLVASGTYVEQVSITTAGKGLYGGYTAGTWARSFSPR